MTPNCSNELKHFINMYQLKIKKFMLLMLENLIPVFDSLCILFDIDMQVVVIIITNGLYVVRVVS